MCHLCGEPVRLDVGPNHPHAYQVDHVIALIRGATAPLRGAIDSIDDNSTTKETP